MALTDIVYQADSVSDNGQTFEMEVSTQSTGSLIDISTANANTNDALVNELNKPTVIVDNRRKVR